MKVAFIGYGSMGRMLAEGFLRRGTLVPGDLAVANRSPGKLGALAGFHPPIFATPDNREAARGASLVFLCVKPMDARAALESIRNELDAADCHVISIAACVTLGMLDRIRPGRYTKAIPSLASEAGSGVTLLCHGPGVRPEEAATAENLFAALGTVKRIQESDFEAAADLTSCAPGLLAAMFRQFVLAGLRHSRIDPADAEEMVMRTVYGTAKLMLEGKLGFQEVIDRVATKGGITEEGVKVLEAGLPPVFDGVFAATLAKHEKIKEALGANLPGMPLP
jgi:pyrroline-5-carboxylate reductase